jgi:hypothetical protein
LAGLKRFEALGGRSGLSYARLWLLHKWKPQQIVMPRVLPDQVSQLEFLTFDGQRLFEMEVHE